MLIVVSDIVGGGSGSLRHCAPPVAVPMDLVPDDVPHHLERLEHTPPDTLISKVAKEPSWADCLPNFALEAKRQVLFFMPN